MALVRAFGEDDVPAVVEVLDPFSDVAYGGTRARLCEHLGAVLEGQGAAVVTIDPTGLLLGFAALLLAEPHHVQLEVLWVDERYRRRGIARAMLSALTPVWADSAISVQLPVAAPPRPVAGLLEQFSFAEAGSDGPPRLWRTRRIRRTTGRASLAPARA